jgi:tetratricopeptide (TPR) repeat protein
MRPAILAGLLALGCEGAPPAPAAPPPEPAPAPEGHAVTEHTTQALEQLRAGDYLAAHLAVAEAMAVAPDDRLRSLRGLALMGRQQPEQARASFDEVLAADPSEPGASVGLGHIAINEQDYQAAQQHLDPVGQACVDRPPGDDPYRAFVCEMAWLGQAWVASNHARFDRALALHERILTLRPDHRLALLGRGNALSGLGRLDEARASFEAVLAGHPDDPYARAELGLVLYNLGDDAGAQRAFEAALAQDPTRYTCPHEGLGLVWLRQGRTDDAKAAFERAIEINPDIEYKKYNGLARILIEEGRPEEARALLERSIANYPYDPEAAQLLESLPE